jgi:hypothetical protein
MKFAYCPVVIYVVLRGFCRKGFDFSLAENISRHVCDFGNYSNCNIN